MVDSDRMLQSDRVRGLQDFVAKWQGFLKGHELKARYLQEKYEADQ